MTNARNIRSRRWRSSNSSRINISICSQITWIRRRRRRRRCTRRGGIYSRAFRASSHLSSPLPKKGGTYRSYDMNGLRRRKLIYPRWNKILWIKIRKNRPWVVELLLWTSIKECMKRWGKLTEVSVTSAYKNAHLSKGIVCRWEIGQMEWQEIRKKTHNAVLKFFFVE